MVDAEGLEAILAHCRSLAAAADRLEELGRGRDRSTADALAVWRGPYGRVFRDRLDDERGDRTRVVDGLRHGADAWARRWAQLLRAENERWRAERLDELSAARSAGEGLAELFVGDDTGRLVRPVADVPAPEAATGYSPTGALERF